MYVRMIRDHEYVADKKTGVRRRIPANWIGNLDDKIAKAAVEAEAKKLLGDATPSAKAEIVEALKAKLAQ